VSAWAGAAGAILLRDWRLMVSYRFRLAGIVLNALLSVTLFHFISHFVNASSFAGRASYFAYVLVGLVILQVLNASLTNAPGALRSEVSTGTFVRLLVSPFGALWGLLSMLVFPVLLALVVGVLILLAGWALFGLAVTWSTAPLAIPVALLGALAFSPFSVLLLAATLQAKQAARGATWVTAGVALVSGLYFPPSRLPAGVRWTADVQPFTPATDLLRHLLVGTPLREHALVDLAKLAGFALVALPLALAVLRLSLGWARRRGTILEY
jgi:ABC-type multidrug transport system permease subunit